MLEYCYQAGRLSGYREQLAVVSSYERFWAIAISS